MTSDEVKARMWEAYKAGMEFRDTEVSPEENFQGWLSQNFPEVANAEAPYFNKAAENGKTDYETRDQRTVESLKADRRPIYWHEYGCKADVHTPHKYRNCTCNGQHPDGRYDHDVECDASSLQPIGGENCSCVGRRAALEAEQDAANLEAHREKNSK